MTAAETLFASAIVVFCVLSLNTCASCMVKKSPSWTCECTQMEAREDKAVCTERVCRRGDAGE